MVEHEHVSRESWRRLPGRDPMRALYNHVCWNDYGRAVPLRITVSQARFIPDLLPAPT